MNTTIAVLVETANILAEIQVEGVVDYVGFSNADKHVGAHLAAIVAANPDDTASVSALAALVGVKYGRQTLTLAGPANLAAFKALGKGSKITLQQRAEARNTVVAQPGDHPKFGPRILFSFPFNEAFALVLRGHEGRAFSGPDGFKWAVPLERAEAAVADLKRIDAKVVGTWKVTGTIQAAPKAARKITCEIRGVNAALSFPYDQGIIAAIKTFPTRRWAPDTKTWMIPARDLALAVEALEAIKVDCSEMRACAAKVAQVARPIGAPEILAVADFDKLPKTPYDFQREGVEFMTRSLEPIRSGMFGGSAIRGVINGDDMGLGKTLQSMIAANAIAQPGERIVIVCPASVKVSWFREIKFWLGEDQPVQIIKSTKTVLDAAARWTVINYDILPTHYEKLQQLGFAVIIVDEAHNCKNRKAMRSKLVVGGDIDMTDDEISASKKAKRATKASSDLVELPQEPTEADPAKKRKKRVVGLCSMATRRVFPLTGTPLLNRPSDLFNLLRMIGHPLGRNWKVFGNRYCAPETKFIGGGRTATEWKGATNVIELRERINSVYIQRKKKDVLKSLPPKTRTFLPVVVDLKLYRGIMADYDARRKSGALSSSLHHLAIISEARQAAAVAKVPATIEEVENALEQEQKVIVFSNHTNVLDMLEAKFKDVCVRIDGSKSQTQRTKAVDGFQGDASKTVFLGNLLAAGEGITLTAAALVIVNDLYWVPAKHLQAEDRAWRIGTKQPVLVRYMIAAGTFDEDLAEMLEEKFGLILTFEGDHEGIDLFPDLVKRLAEGPQNEGARSLLDGRQKSINKSAAA